MANVSYFLQDGQYIDHTPASALYAGNVFQVGSVCAFTPCDVAANTIGAAMTSGVIRGPYVGGLVGQPGQNVYWDADGTPYGGSADGAFTLDATAADWWAGTLVAATSATGATCDIALNKENPELPSWRNKDHVATAIDLSWVAATHNGKVIHVTADAKTVTMPIGVAGMEAIIVNDVADGGALVTIDFNGNETLEGNLTIPATKTANNTKATAKRGDFLHIRCETAATLWVCLAKRGTWVASS